MPSVRSPKRITLRSKNQLTLPPDIVSAAELKKGDTFRVIYEEEHDVIKLIPLSQLSFWENNTFEMEVVDTEKMKQE